LADNNRGELGIWGRGLRARDRRLGTGDGRDGILANNAAGRQDTAEGRDVESCFGAGEKDPVTHSTIDAHERLEGGPVDEIDLVNADNWADPVLLRGHKESVDQIRLEIGLGRAGNNEHLIDVGDDDMLPAAASAREDAAARLDSLDEAIARRIQAER